MDLYCKEIRKWESNFYGIEYIHVVRDKNQAADALSKLGSLLGILNANRKIRKRTDTDVAFTREYSRVSIFHREREYTN